MEGKRDYKRKGTKDFQMGVNYVSQEKDYFRPHTYHPEAEMLLVHEGKGTLQINGINIPLETGNFYFIYPNEVHSIHTFGRLRMRTLIFSKEAVTMGEDHFFQKEFVQPLWDGRLKLPRILTPEHPAYRTIFDQLTNLKNHFLYTPHYKAGRLCILMTILTALIPYGTIDETSVSIQDTTNATVRKCLLYLHNFYKKPLTLEQIAAHLNLNPNYLCTMFHRYTGQSIFTHLTHIRIEHGATLLQTTDLPVSEIAVLAGFRSECLFYRKFKEITGMTPLAYRKQQTHTEE